MNCLSCNVVKRVSEFAGVFSCSCVRNFFCEPCKVRCIRQNMLQHVGANKHLRLLALYQRDAVHVANAAAQAFLEHVEQVDDLEVQAPIPVLVVRPPIEAEPIPAAGQQGLAVRPLVPPREPDDIQVQREEVELLELEVRRRKLQFELRELDFQDRKLEAERVSFEKRRVLLNEGFSFSPKRPKVERIEITIEDSPPRVDLDLDLFMSESDPEIDVQVTGDLIDHRAPCTNKPIIDVLNLVLFGPEPEPESEFESETEASPKNKGKLPLPIRRKHPFTDDLTKR